MRTIPLTIALGLVLLSVPTAEAQRTQRGTDSCHCPAGTCATDGSTRAAWCRYCKASNCPGYKGPAAPQAKKRKSQ